MKVRIFIVIICFVLISCSNRTDNKTTSSTEKREIVQTEKSKKIEKVTENEYDKLVKKTAWFKNGLKKQNDLIQLPESFLGFYKKFVTDSVFQKENVNFKELIGIIGDCEETTYLSDKNWEFIDWDFIKFFKEGSETEPIEKWNNTVYTSEDKILFEFEIKEVGLTYQLGFEKYDENWKLTLYFVNAC